MSNKSDLVTIFQQLAVPQGTDFANLINSSINLAETATQTMAGALQAPEFDTPLVSAAIGNIQNLIVSLSTSITCDVSAVGQNIYCSGTRYSLPAIVSAFGTAQATGTPLTSTICRLQGITDGQATGFSLLANKTGWVQYLLLESGTSANLWPPTGGKINNLSTNAVFPLTGGTAYTVFHTQASAYGVK